MPIHGIGVLLSRKRQNPNSLSDSIPFLCYELARDFPLRSGCYTCNPGYLKNTASNTCDVPGQGKYVNGSGVTRLSGPGCNPIEFSDNTKGVSSATGCNFSCCEERVELLLYTRAILSHCQWCGV